MAEGTGVLLADEHVILLDALSLALAQHGHRVLGTVTTRSGLLDAVRALQPPLCVAGDAFLTETAEEVLRQIALVSPATRVVVVTSDGDRGLLQSALECGVSGFVHSSRGVHVLLDALRRVVQGEIVVESSFSRRYDDRREPTSKVMAAYLTNREVECLRLLASGMDTRGIARRLGVSPTTVRTHVQAVLSKLGVHSRLEAAALAIRSGMVEPQAGAVVPHPRRTR